MSQEINPSPGIQEHTYFVRGMHCASCEIFIERVLLGLPGVESAEAKTSQGIATIEYTGQLPTAEELTRLFHQQHYIFSDQPISFIDTKDAKDKDSLWIVGGVALLIIIGFIGLNRLGLTTLIDVNLNSSLWVFLLFGLLAGVSSCAALVGGMVLSMSKQWADLYAGHLSTLQKLQPHLLFNTGRILSYFGLGIVLGTIGSQLQISLSFASTLTIVVSVVMLLLALQMLGVKALRQFQFTLPKWVTRYIADESHFHGGYMPFLMGALTFFLPCGFTITVQGLALLSGNPWQAGLMMLFFALGTTPMLLTIGFSSVKFSSRPLIAGRFLKIAGVLVLFFAFFNINNQLTVLGLPSLHNLNFRLSQVTRNLGNFPMIVDGKQILKMEAFVYGYKPAYLKVKAGIPVRWEITDSGSGGCTNAVIATGLFAEAIPLIPGQTSVKEFMPPRPGRYVFSCWMGMVAGILDVVDKS